MRSVAQLRALPLLGALMVLAGGALAQEVPSRLQPLDQLSAHAEIGSALFELIADRPVAAARRLEWLRAHPAGRSLSESSAAEAELRFLLSTAYFRMGSSSRFRELAEPLLNAVAPERAAALRAQLAMDAYARGETAEAVALVPAGSSDPLLRFVAGLAHYRGGNFAAARETFGGLRTSSGAYGPFARYMSALSLASAEPSRTMEAVDSLRALATDDADGELAHVALHAGARLAYAVRRYDVAAQLGGEVPVSSGDYLPAATVRAWALYHRQQLEAAASLFSDIADHHPDTPEGAAARVMAAQVLLEAGRPSAAADAFAGASTLLAGHAQAVASVEATAVAAASRAIVAARTTDMFFVDASSAMANVAAPTSEAANAAALLGDRVEGMIDRAMPMLVSIGARERWLAELGPRIRSGFPLRIMREPSSGRVDGAEHERAVLAVREADVEVAIARFALREAEQRNAVRLAQLSGLERLVSAESAGLMAVERRLHATHDSLARVLGSLGESRDRVRRFVRSQIEATRELASENSAIADSVAESLAGHLSATEREVVTLERATAVEFASLARMVDGGLETAIARHPVFAHHDSVGARLEQNRVLLGQARSQIAATSRIALSELDRQRDLAPPELLGARAMLDVAVQRRRDAEERLRSLVEQELLGRAARALAFLRRDVEVADFGAASSMFFAAVQQDAASAVIPGSASAQPPTGSFARVDRVQPRDAAIERLSAFVSRYPDSEFRPTALAQLSELLIRRADAQFAAAQRAGGDVPERPDYRPAIARLDELTRNYPADERMDETAYTLGVLHFSAGQFNEAVRMFELVSGRESSSVIDEALFRLGDSYFELAAHERGAQRRELFARAARAYARATEMAPRGGDIYFLSLYKLGWSFYNQAGRANPGEYTRSAEIFGRLIAEYDRAPAEQQARLGLRNEAIEYMAVAFTQTGGADAAARYFADGRGSAFRLAVLRRMAASLRDQGAFAQAVDAYRAVIAEAPTDPEALLAQREVVAIHSTRTLDVAAAHQARLELVERYGPGSAWASANPAFREESERVTEEALRLSAQFALSRAQAGERTRFAEAARLYGNYVSTFTRSDSLQPASFLHGEALFGAGSYAEAGRAYSAAAYVHAADRRLAAQAGQNAIVAFDSALTRAPQDRAAQDSLFRAVDRYVQTFGDPAVSRGALVQKGRRASEAERWEEMAEAFRTYAERYPSDPYTPTAQKLIGDALYRQGRYADAQRQWDAAQSVAERAGRRALVDSLVTLRAAATSAYADSLVARGEFARAAEEAYVPYADANPRAERAPDALRNAIETYLLADSAARSRGDGQGSREARERAIELAQRLTSTYPAFAHRSQYRALRSELLDELGRRDEAIDGWRELIREDQGWPGRADAMVRVAVSLDSLRRPRESAAMYEQFSQAYPQDPRAADAQFNAAVAYVEAADTAAAARAYGAFATRFPRNPLVGQAQQARIGLLRAAGDVRTAEAELDRLCAQPPDHLRAECADRAGERAYGDALALLPEYQSLRLVLRTRAQLTRAGVERASARKQELLRTMTAQLTRAIETGSPEWLSAATYVIGLLQWDYGNYLRNTEFPPDLTDEQRESAEVGAEQQAIEYDRAATELWRSLLQKADEDRFDNVWVSRAREALEGSVFTTPAEEFRQRGTPPGTGGTTP